MKTREPNLSLKRGQKVIYKGYTGKIVCFVQSNPWLMYIEFDKINEFCKYCDILKRYSKTVCVDERDLEFPE